MAQPLQVWQVLVATIGTDGADYSAELIRQNYGFLRAVCLYCRGVDLPIHFQCYSFSSEKDRAQAMQLWGFGIQFADPEQQQHCAVIAYPMEHIQQQANALDDELGVSPHSKLPRVINQ